MTRLVSNIQSLYSNLRPSDGEPIHLYALPDPIPPYLIERLSKPDLTFSSIDPPPMQAELKKRTLDPTKYDPKAMGKQKRSSFNYDEYPTLKVARQGYRVTDPYYYPTIPTAPSISPTPSSGVYFSHKDYKEEKAPRELRIEVVKHGSGRRVELGDYVTISCNGSFRSDGSVFIIDQIDSLQFEVGVGEVVQGVDEGVVGMQVGEIRRLTVPPKMGYGNKGNLPEIPSNCVLSFEVMLMSVYELVID